MLLGHLSFETVKLEENIVSRKLAPVKLKDQLHHLGLSLKYFDEFVSKASHSRVGLRLGSGSEERETRMGSKNLLTKSNFIETFCFVK